MAETIHLEVAVPTGLLCEEDVDEVQLPGAEGSFGVRPGHAALITTLEHGVLSLHQGTDVRKMAVHKGIAEILPDRVRVLADEAAWSDDITSADELAVLQDATHKLEERAAGTDYEAESERVERAQARLRAAGAEH